MRLLSLAPLVPSRPFALVGVFAAYDDGHGSRVGLFAIPHNDLGFAHRFKEARLRARDFYEKELAKLEAVFADMPIDSIKPHHVRRYLDIRGQKAKVRANRERALLSHVFNCAREWGYTDAANPCAGVKGHRETGRDRYVEDDEDRAVWNCAHFTVQTQWTWPI